MCKSVAALRKYPKPEALRLLQMSTEALVENQTEIPDVAGLLLGRLQKMYLGGLLKISEGLSMAVNPGPINWVLALFPSFQDIYLLARVLSVV